MFLDEAALDSVSASAHLIFVSERRLGFGTHGASNIAQRFSDALLNLFRIDMDTADADTLRYGLSGPMDEWLSAREAVAAATQAECADRTAHTREPVGGVQPTLPDFCLQTRLYTAYMFSDDPAFIVVGVDRAILALRIWRRLTDDVGLLMAIPEKRALGSHAIWLGVIIFVSLGIAVIPLAKLLRASFTIHRVLNSGIAFSTYRSLCGLLEHFRDVCLVGKTTMFSLYDPHGANGASARGPDGWVTCSQLMRQQLNKWLVLIASCGGLNVKSAFLSCKLAPASLLKIISSVDACYGDTDPTGVGGFCHGLWWYFLVPLLDISRCGRLLAWSSSATSATLSSCTTMCGPWSARAEPPLCSSRTLSTLSSHWRVSPLRRHLRGTSMPSSSPRPPSSVCGRTPRSRTSSAAPTSSLTWCRAANSRSSSTCALRWGSQQCR